MSLLSSCCVVLINHAYLRLELLELAVTLLAVFLDLVLRLLLGLLETTLLLCTADAGVIGWDVTT